MTLENGLLEAEIQQLQTKLASARLDLDYMRTERDCWKKDAIYRHNKAMEYYYTVLHFQKKARTWKVIAFLLLGLVIFLMLR